MLNQLLSPVIAPNATVDPGGGLEIAAHPAAVLESSSQSKTDPLAISVFLLTTAFTLFANLRLRSLVSDDAYIHARIAENLTATGHPFFNPGEAVMATSSPVWTLFLAAQRLLFGEFNVVPFWNAVFTGCAALAAYFLARAAGSSPRMTRSTQGDALLPALLAIVALLDSSYMQMETPLAMALLLWSAVAFTRDSRWTLPLLMIAVFTRPELALLFLAVALGGIAASRFKRPGLYAAAAVGAILLLWLFSQFGTVIPNSVRAKKIGYTISAWQSFMGLFPAWSSGLPSEGTPVAMLGVSVALVLLMQVLTLVKSPRPWNQTQVAAAALSVWGYSLALLYVWNKTLIFSWYQPMVTAPILVGMATGLRFERTVIRKLAPACGLALMLYVFLPPLLPTVRAAALQQPELSPFYSQAARVHEYLAVGGAVARVCPQARLMTSEIGALGYSFKGYVLDGFGIASPDALKYHPMHVPVERSHGSLGAIPIRFVAEKRPDLIVSFDVFAQSLLRSRQVSAQYTDLRFPPLLPEDAARPGVHRWISIVNLHVLVRNDGGCSASEIAREISKRF